MQNRASNPTFLGELKFHAAKTIANAKMGLNLSRGEAIKYYSSDRITQIVGNGLVCLIDEKTQYRDFFSNDEMVFYKNLNDLSEKIRKIPKNPGFLGITRDP